MLEETQKASTMTCMQHSWNEDKPQPSVDRMRSLFLKVSIACHFTQRKHNYYIAYKCTSTAVYTEAGSVHHMFMLFLLQKQITFQQSSILLPISSQAVMMRGLSASID